MRFSPWCRSSALVHACLALIWVGAHASADEITWRGSGKGGAVAAGHPNSVAAGLKMLEDGGNAADAATATLLALAVTDYGLFAMGGEVPLLIYDARKKEVKALCGLGSAPLDPRAIEWFYEKYGKLWKRRKIVRQEIRGPFLS